MKCFCPLSVNPDTNIFKNINSGIFNPFTTNIKQNQSNFHNIKPGQNFGIWNKYQNLYNQIISHDKKSLNAIQNKKQDIFECKPFLSEIKIMVNDDADVEKDKNNSINSENNKDKEVMLLNNKRKKEKIYEINKCPSQSTNNESFSKKSSRGRKKKIENIKGKHTKFTSDNIMRKIKCHFFNYINDSLNKNLIDKNQIFFKLNNFVNENLKKDYNIILMKQTIKEIYLKYPISNKYKKYEKDINKNLIERVYSENKEIEVIKILDKTYIEIFNKLMEIELEKFCNEILEKDEKNGLLKEDSVDYLKNIKDLCINYEKWFSSKKGRKENK